MSNFIPNNCDTNSLGCTFNDLIPLIDKVIKYAVIIVIPLAAAAIAAAGIYMIINAGKEDKIKQAKDIIWGAVWGIVLVLAAYLIVKFVFQIFGVKEGIGIMEQIF